MITPEAIFGEIVRQRRCESGVEESGVEGSGVKESKSRESKSRESRVESSKPKAEPDSLRLGLMCFSSIPVECLPYVAT